MRMRTYILGCLLALCYLTANAYDFETGGLCYTILSLQDRTVEVSYVSSSGSSSDTLYSNPSPSKYTGDYIEIPSTLLYKNAQWNVVKIGNYAFYGSSVKNVEIANSIKTIGHHAFASSKVKTIIPLSNGSSYGLDSLGKGVFAGCNFDALYIPQSVRVVSAGTYYYDSSSTTETKTLNIEDSEQEIKICNWYTVANLYMGREIHKPDQYPYDNISGVKVLSIGDKVNKVNSISFKDIDTIVVQNPVPPTLDVEIPNIVFVDAVVYVPDNCIEQYKNDATWGKFFDIRTLSSYPRNESRVIKYKTSDGKPIDSNWSWNIVKNANDESLLYLMQEYKDGVGQLIYNEDITELKEYFLGNHWSQGFVNYNVIYIEIPNGVKKITDNTFNSTLIKTYVFPETLEELGSYAMTVSYTEQVDVYCLNPTPPTIVFRNKSSTSDINNSSFSKKMIIHVPVGSKNAYLAAPVWKDLNIVEGTEVSAISTVSTNTDRSKSVFYKLDGTKVTTPTTGIYIERLSDGSTHKVLVK